MKTTLRRVFMHWRTLLAASFLTLLAGTVTAQYKGTPVTMDKLLNVVQTKQVPTEKIVETIKNNGVNFEVTARNEFDLKKAGADDSIIEAAKTNYRDSKLRYLTFENGTTTFATVLMTWATPAKETITSQKELAPGIKERILFPANASNIRLSITRNSRSRDADMVVDQHELEPSELNRCLHLTDDQSIYQPCK